MMGSETVFYKKIIVFLLHSLLLILTIFIIIAGVVYINKDRLSSFVNSAIIQNFTNYYSETRVNEIRKLDDNINSKINQELVLIAENNLKERSKIIDNRLNELDDTIEGTIIKSINHEISAIMSPLHKKYEQEIQNFEENNGNFLQSIHQNSLPTGQIYNSSEIAEKLDSYQHILNDILTKNSALTDEMNKLYLRMDRSAEEAPTSGEEVAKLAELAHTEQKNENNDLALMYLMKAIYKSNFSIEYINKYIQAIEEMSHNKNISKETAIGYVENGIRFLTTLTPSISIKDIDALYSDIKALANTLEKLVDETEIVLEKVEVPALCAESYNKGMLAEAKQGSIKELEETYNACFPFIDDMPQEQKKVFQALPGRIENLKKESFVAEQSQLIAEQIDACKNLKDTQLALASLADLQGKIVNLITVSDNKKLLELYHRCTGCIQDISDKIENDKYDEIIKKYNIPSDNGRGKININNLSSCMLELNRLLSYVNNPQLRDAIQKKISKISELMNSSRKNYNRWALNQIENCYNNFNNNVDKATKAFRKEDDTFDLLNRYLSWIDVNLLSSNVMQIYNEVYSLLSTKLSTKKKIELANAFELTPKKGLGDV